MNDSNKDLNEKQKNQLITELNKTTNSNNNYVISYTQPNEGCLAVNLIGGSMVYIKASLQEIKYIVNNPLFYNKYLFEVINRLNAPDVKLYADIDCLKNKPIKVDEIKPLIIKPMSDFLATKGIIDCIYNIAYKLYNGLTSSIHIVISNYKMNFLEQKQLAKDMNLYFEKYNITVNDIPLRTDEKVYTKNRNFCLPNQGKNDPNNKGYIFKILDDDDSVDPFIINDTSQCILKIYKIDKIDKIDIIDNEINTKQTAKDKRKNFFNIVVFNDLPKRGELDKSEHSKIPITRQNIIESFIKYLPKTFYTGDYWVAVSKQLILMNIYNVDEWLKQSSEFSTFTVEQNQTFKNKVIDDYNDYKQGINNNSYTYNSFIFNFNDFVSYCIIRLNINRIRTDLFNLYDNDVLVFLSKHTEISISEITKKIRRVEFNATNEIDDSIELGDNHIYDIKSMLLFNRQTNKVIDYQVKHIYPSIYKTPNYKHISRDEATDICRNAVSDDFNGMLVIGSIYGGGKGHFCIRSMLDEAGTDKRTLIITENNSLNLELVNKKFKGFNICSHKTDDFRTTYKNYNVVVCSLESLHLIDDDYFHILILDEIESLLSHFNSETLEKQYNQRVKIISTFTKFIKESRLVALMDADISDERINIIRNEKSNCNIEKYYMNADLWDKVEHTIYMGRFEKAFYNRLYENINEGKKILIPCSFKRTANSVFEKLYSSMNLEEGDDGFLKQGNILLIDSEQLKIYNEDGITTKPMTYKNKVEMMNDLKAFLIKHNIAYMLFSPIITTGVSIDGGYFHSVFSFQGSKSTTVKKFKQMLYRDRQVKDINILLEGDAVNLRNITSKTKQEITNTINDILRDRYADNNIINFNTTYTDEVSKLLTTYSNMKYGSFLYNNFINNEVENNKRKQFENELIAGMACIQNLNVNIYYEDIKASKKINKSILQDARKAINEQEKEAFINSDIIPYNKYIEIKNINSSEKMKQDNQNLLDGVDWKNSYSKTSGLRKLGFLKEIDEVNTNRYMKINNKTLILKARGYIYEYKKYRNNELVDVEEDIKHNIKDIDGDIIEYRLYRSEYTQPSFYSTEILKLRNNKTGSIYNTFIANSIFMRDEYNEINDSIADIATKNLNKVDAVNLESTNNNIFVFEDKFNNQVIAIHNKKKNNKQLDAVDLTKNTLKQNKTKTLKVFEKMLNCGDRTQPHRYTLRDVKDILDNNKHIIKHLNNIDYQLSEPNKKYKWVDYDGSIDYIIKFIKVYNDISYSLLSILFKYQSRTKKTLDSVIYIDIPAFMKRGISYNHNKYNKVDTKIYVCIVNKKITKVIGYNNMNIKPIEVEFKGRSVIFKIDDKILFSKIVKSNLPRIFKGVKKGTKEIISKYYDKNEGEWSTVKKSVYMLSLTDNIKSKQSVIDLEKYKDDEAVVWINMEWEDDEPTEQEKEDASNELSDVVSKSPDLLTPLFKDKFESRRLDPIYNHTDIYKYNSELELLPRDEVEYNHTIHKFNTKQESKDLYKKMISGLEDPLFISKCKQNKIEMNEYYTEMNKFNSIVYNCDIITLNNKTELNKSIRNFNMKS